MQGPAEFEQLDAELKLWGTPLLWRPLGVFKRLHGIVNDPEQRTALMEPIRDWFLQVYGEAVRWDGVLGKFPIIIRNNLYTGIALYAFEDRPGVYKEHILDLPPEVSDTFDTEDFRYIAERLTQVRNSFHMLYNLSIEDHCFSDEARHLFNMGVRDLESATALLVHTKNVQGSIVASHEAAEKFLKIALLRSRSQKSPRSFLHNVPALFDELAMIEPRYGWLIKPAKYLQKLSPNMDMRYMVMQRSESDAVSAFMASIHICGVLANIWLFDHDRGQIQPRFVADKFYTNAAGRTYYCKQVNDQQATLLFFHLHRFGHQLAEIKMNILESSLYMEVTDLADETRLRLLLIRILRNPGVRVTPEQVLLHTVDGNEGSYTAMMLTRQLSREPT
jgi:HEPN domain-containing protein